MSDENYWINKTIFSYTDPVTTVQLTAYLECMMGIEKQWDNIASTKFSICIKDSRIQGTPRVKIELELPQIFQLVDTFDKLAANWNNAFKSNVTVNIVKFFAKKKKELTFEFVIIDGSPYVKTSVYDTVGNSSRLFVHLDKYNYMSIYMYLKSMIANFAIIDSNMTNVLYNKRFYTNIHSDIIAIKEKSHELVKRISNAPMNYTTQTNNITVEAVDIDEPINNENINYVASDFMAHIGANGFDDIDIGQSELKDEMNAPKPKDRSTNTFLNNFINNDVDVLKQWATSFTCLTEKSQPDMFSPFDIIMNMTGLTSDIRDKYRKDSGYYLSQYYIISLLKSAIKTAIINNGNYPTNVPMFKFSTKIVKGTDEYEVCKEITVVFLIFSMLINGFMNWIKTNNEDMMKIEEYRRVYFILKLLFNPFIFSVQVEDGYKDELLEVWDTYEKSGFFDKIMAQYSEITLGGNLKIDRSIFDKFITNFITKIFSSPTINIDDTQNIKISMDSAGIPLYSKIIDGPLAIKEAIFKKNITQEVIHNTPCTVVESDISEVIENNKVEEKQDERFELFIRCGLRFSKEFCDNIMQKCHMYSQITQYLKDADDVPPEIFKIKRVMDLDTSLSNITEVLRLAKLITEDPNVTMSRATDGDELDDYGMDSNFSVEDVIGDDDIPF